MYDLHVHSTCSDGAVKPEMLPHLAAKRKIRGFALTDHDTLCGVERAREAAKRYEIDVLTGAELSAFDPATGRRVHLLALCPQRPEALYSTLKAVTRSREEACLKALDVLKRLYPVCLDDVHRYCADAEGIFRTHIMRALMEQGYADRVFGPLYRELFGKDCGKAYFPVDYTPMEEAAQAARAAGCFVVLAHPGVYDSFDAAEKLAKNGLIDGIEGDYPRRKPEDIPKISAVAEKYSLTLTGGTDFHGFHASPANPLGTCTTADETVEIIKNGAISI